MAIRSVERNMDLKRDSQFATNNMKCLLFDLAEVEQLLVTVAHLDKSLDRTI